MTMTWIHDLSEAMEETARRRLRYPVSEPEEAPVPRVRTFTGTRPDPPAEYAGKGITNSGTEPDYEGAVFSDGTVVVRWQTAYRSHSVWSCWADFWHVHGHPEYGTVVDFADGQPAPPVAA